jgi:hypothetical protein
LKSFLSDLFLLFVWTISNCPIGRYTHMAHFTAAGCLKR